MNESFELRYDPIKKDYLYLHRTTTFNMGTFYHQHEAYELYLLLRGNVNFYIENSCFRLEPGDLLVIHPDEMHRSFSLDDSEYERITINLQKSYLNSLSTSSTNLSDCFDNRPKGKGNIVHLDESRRKQFLQIANHLEDVIASDAYGSDVLANSYIAQLLVLTNAVFKNADFTPRDIMPELVRKTMDYIESNLSQNISLEHLSAAFYLNSTYISRQFKKHTGLTLRSYILERRISLAKSYLREGFSITEACFQSGFSDYANFIRSFTKIAGISPGKFAKKRANLP
ncbi:AraC family transcriptional regulator [Paenibacillus cellulositrophicus]|uniref:AraC family transcriptional regulator n=1 Tax=Paenibacillus cellulositrophicus TaxID=562959 RepID=UPI00203A6167|nr:AraC family transcriptional regulator [Paenibacillus cellulositrophicus]MCM2998495.1 AraC family transcriptional regulator [Paenibacillus cellulositrophicus]